MQPQFLRRKTAAQYLKEKYGFGSERSLAKLAVIGGGPNFRKAGGSIVLYEPSALDDWALAKIGGLRTSTSHAVAEGEAPTTRRGRPPNLSADSVAERAEAI